MPYRRHHSSSHHAAARLVYDGECGFCRYTVDYARAVTGEAVEYVPYQAVVDEYPDRSEEDFAASIWLFASGTTASGADAAFRTLAVGGRGRWLWVYRRIPGFAWLSERLYGWVSRHRELCLRIARALFGRELRPARFDVTADVVYRGIAAATLMALGSLWLQAETLIGDHGVLPAAEFLEAVHATFGSGSYWTVPTVLWCGISFHWVFAFGTLCALVGLAGKLRTSAALGAYAAYLSIVGVGQTFTAYQWDMFLIECLFAAAILGRSPVVGIWVLRLLAFRFMFLSGAVKLLSGDPAWADLTALEYHFETQPLPTFLAPFAHRLPASALAVAVAATFAIELVLPFLIFGPRKLRATAAWAFIGFEVLILATGNYNFFNLLTIVVCLALFDDRLFRVKRLPKPQVRRVGAAPLPGYAIVGRFEGRRPDERQGIREPRIGVRSESVRRHAGIRRTDPDDCRVGRHRLERKALAVLRGFGRNQHPGSLRVGTWVGAAGPLLRGPGGIRGDAHRKVARATARPSGALGTGGDSPAT